ncbi:MAG: M48 family metallopeptidase [Bacteroidales bacterium]|nr:M48 family metallopeptidase [Bacteroidales bacterium]
MFLLIGMSIILIGFGFVIGMAVEPETGGIMGVIIATALYFILLLVAFTQGKSIMLHMSNAKEVSKSEYQQLYNIVEEMQIASGMAVMPKIYVIDDPAPNAFAAGMSPKNSVVAVTSGLLNMMNRDELQGVVAHEVSHIINRDVRYMTIATIMVASVALLSQFFLRSMFYGGGRSRSNSKGGGKGQIIILVVAVVFAILAPILIRLLYFALSRKREYLADASAARLTRFPLGLASALEKIGGSALDLSGANKTTAPMYIANPLKQKGRKLRNLSSTHPPLEDRIRILKAMGNEYSYANYQQAYSSVTNTKGNIIPSGALAENK